MHVPMKVKWKVNFTLRPLNCSRMNFKKEKKAPPRPESTLQSPLISPVFLKISFEYSTAILPFC